MILRQAGSHILNFLQNFNLCGQPLISGFQLVFFF